MIITCENCSTSFNLDEKFIKPSGSKVRCSKCKNLFIAYPPVPEKEEIEEAPVKEAPEDSVPAPPEKDQEDMAPEKEEIRGAGEVPPEEPVAESDAVQADQGEDLDLDLGMESADELITETVEESMETVATSMETVETSMETIEASMDTVEEPMEESEAPSDELDLDLDLEMDSEEDLVAETAELPKEESDALSDELDFDLDLDMDSEEDLATETAELPKEEGEAPSDELELDLDFEMESEPESEVVGEEEAESEVLDFSDFEATIEMDSPPVPDAGEKSEEAAQDFDLDLDLDLDLEEEPASVSEAEMASVSSKEGEDLEDIDLDIDLDLKMETEDTEDVSLEEEKTEDFDLSDIEKMLEPETETPVAEDVDTGRAEKIAEVEKWKQQPVTDGFMDETAEIDLSDIVLDGGEADEEEIEDQELQLDIEEEPDQKEKEAFAGKVKDASDIDLSELEEFEIPDEEEPATGGFEGGDIELEFEVDGEKTPAGMRAFDSAAEPETVAFAAPLIDSDETLDETAKKKAAKKVKVPRKSNVGKPVLVVLILLVVAFGAVIILDRIDISIPVVTDYVKNMPYVNQLMKPEPVQMGEISIANINSRFVNNAKHGKFFVITGTAINDFPESRRYIKLDGTLYRTGKTMAKEESVYGGNVITDADLAKMDFAEIKKILGNRFGDKKTNFDVKPGQEIPFMIVFSDLPDDLEEFAIEVAGSFPVQQQ